MIERTKIVVNTEKQFTALDEYIHDFIKDKKGNGMVNVFCSAYNMCGKSIEGELLLLADINNYLNQCFPKDGNYMHDKIEIRDVPINEREVNGFAHLRQLFSPPMQQYRLKMER